MTDIDAVCFDLDGTLCVDDQSDEAIYEAIFERVAVPEFFGLEDLYAVDYAALPDADSERDRHENVYRAIAENVGADPSYAPALAEATVEARDPTAVSFRDGAEEAFEYARERYAVGLLTNGFVATQTAKVDALGVRDALNTTVVCGGDTELPSKPEPTAFRQVLDDLDVAPESAVFVGDRLDGDIAGASAAGMETVWVPIGDAPPNPEPEPTYHLSSMRDPSDVL